MTQPKYPPLTLPFTAPQAYPSPQERERLIERRFDLLQKLIMLFAAQNEPRQSTEMPKLVREYGKENVEIVIRSFSQRTAMNYLTEASALYRNYRQTFARFGGNRRWLSKLEYETLQHERVQRFGAAMIEQFDTHHYKNKAQTEFEDVMLVSPEMWQDITPLAIPPRPPDFQSPSSAAYTPTARAILNWGIGLDVRTFFRHANSPATKSLMPTELVKMTLDPELLDGFLGEASSWAPYHALHLLGVRRAHEVAGQLLALLDHPNDWLSDRLPDIWAQMGPPAQPPLWKNLDDPVRTPHQRGIVLEALRVMAIVNPTQHDQIVARLTKRLRESTDEDKKTNGYIIFVLNRLRAMGSYDVITEAFDQDKVDPTVIQLQDIDFGG